MSDADRLAALEARVDDLAAQVYSMQINRVDRVEPAPARRGGQVITNMKHGDYKHE